MAEFIGKEQIVANFVENAENAEELAENVIVAVESDESSDNTRPQDFPGTSWEADHASTFSCPRW